MGKRYSKIDLRHKLSGQYGPAFDRAFPIIQKSKHHGIAKLRLDAWLMVMHFLGYELPDFLAKVSQIDLQDIEKTRVDWAAMEIAQLRREQPDLLRMEIHSTRPFASRHLLKKAKEIYENLMPKARGNKNHTVDWAARDAQCCEALNVLMDGSTTTDKTRKNLLATVGIQSPTRCLLRMPLTKAFISKVTFIRRGHKKIHWGSHAEALKFAREQFEELRKQTPGLTISEFRKKNPFAYRLILKHAPDVLPARQTLDWSKRDRDLKQLLERTIPNLTLDCRCCIGKILSAIGESVQLIQYAAELLPLTSDIIKVTVKSARVERKNYLKKQPKKKASLPHHLAADWGQRDTNYVQTILSKKHGLTSLQRSSPTRILKAVGISHFALINAMGRLPKTEALLSTLVEPHDLIEEKRQKLVRLIKKNPTLGREAIAHLDRTTVDGVRIADRDFFERVMPRRLH